jgi:transposase-like protein
MKISNTYAGNLDPAQIFLAMPFGFIIVLHLAFEISKNYVQHAVLWQATKPSVNGVLHYLWRALDQDGDEIDILVQKRKNKKAAMRFLNKTVKGSAQL